MLNTSKQKTKIWINKQDALIASLKLQPLIVVIRPTQNDFPNDRCCNIFLQKIEDLHNAGIKHIEIGWSPMENWISLVKELKQRYPNIFFGAASITNEIALKAVANADLFYAMTPVWDQTLQEKAREREQVLVPGVLTPSEIQHAIFFGWKIIKLFPASTFGLNYLQQIKAPLQPLPYLIAAGGLHSTHIEQWLNAGYNAITLGRGLKEGKVVDPSLRRWLQKEINQVSQN